MIKNLSILFLGGLLIGVCLQLTKSFRYRATVERYLNCHDTRRQYNDNIGLTYEDLIYCHNKLIERYNK